MGVTNKVQGLFLQVRRTFDIQLSHGDQVCPELSQDNQNVEPREIVV